MRTSHSHNVHVVLQGKGGVGKSAAAAFLTEYLAADSRRVTCIDTDPFNATFSAYQTLNVHRVDIMLDHAIDPRRFDDMMDLIVAEPRDVVIDNGASTFVPLAHYLLIHQVAALLVALGRSLVLHVLITGGPAIFDTLEGLDSLLRHFPDPCRFCVWLNPFFGPIRDQGKTFEDFTVYTEHRARISALITLPELHPDTFGADLRALLLSRRTLSEAVATPATGLVTRQRLSMVRRQIFAQLQAAAYAGIL
jgi:CobQ/CobB/MinD/ParA nucleotide binding domain